MPKNKIISDFNILRSLQINWRDSQISRFIFKQEIVVEVFINCHLFISSALRPIIVFASKLVFVSGGFHWTKTKGQLASANEAPILAMVPHSSFFDALPAVYLGLTTTVSKIETFNIPIFGSMSTTYCFKLWWVTWCVCHVMCLSCDVSVMWCVIWTFHINFTGTKIFLVLFSLL